jgi:hypothetical protein
MQILQWKVPKVILFLHFLHCLHNDSPKKAHFYLNTVSMTDKISSWCRYLLAVLRVISTEGNILQLEEVAALVTL